MLKSFNKKTDENTDAEIQNIIINNMKKYLNKHNGNKGLWYPNDYFKYLRKKGFKLNKNVLDRIYDGYADPNFFEKTNSFTFKLKDKKLPSDGVLTFLEGPTIADCANATLVIYYKSLIDLIGKEVFDQLYKDNFTIWVIMNNPVDHFVFKNPPERSDEFMIGDHLHFSGVKWYTNKHPQGFGGGWNVIYVGKNEKGEDTFNAHGFKKPKTEKEIFDSLIKDYNAKRTKKDLEFIEKEKGKDKNNSLYDKKRNKWLIEFYRINTDFHNYPKKINNFFVDGYLPETLVRM